MKPKFNFRHALLAAATLAVSSIPLHATTINLDLATDNSGPISLASGDNTFSFSGFSVQYLIVAGGGAGGTTSSGTNTDAGGGGGAGGLLQGTTSIGGAQTIQVGGGGSVNTGNGGKGGDGSNSSAFSLTAIGGGGGGWAGQSPGSGGSGGGAGSRSSADGGTGGSGTAGQGNAGGSRASTGARGGASGGGAGGAGNDNDTTTTGADGGLGVSSSITGVATTYAAGGGGGAGPSTGATGGSSATGGSGGDHSQTGSAADDNTGGGGGGGAGQNRNNGGAGGSGIVVVRYSGPQVLSGGDVTTVDGDTVHQFKTTGTSTLDLHSATINGDIDGDGNLLWNKTGTLTLGGENTYGGTTSVTSGILRVNGDQSGAAGNVSIASGATLTGVGTLGGATTISGIHAPGNGVGSQSFSNGLTYASGSVFVWDLNANSNTSGFDTVNVTGDLTVDSSTIFRIVLGDDISYTSFWNNPDETRTWSNIFAFGDLIGGFSTSNIEVTGSGAANIGLGSFSIDGTELTWTAIPEPTTALAGLLLGLGLLRRRRA